MSAIAGIDLSSHAVDCVLIDENDHRVIAWHRWQLTANGDAFDRTRWVRDSMPSRGWWKDEGVIAAGIEDPRGQSAGVIYRVQGAIISCLPTWLLVHPLNPGEWRKLIGIPGNATKEMTRDWVRAQVGSVAGSWPNDATDAYGIARATSSLLDQSVAA